MLQKLQRLNKTTRIIVLTASDDKNEFVQAMKLGCSGIVLKQTAPELIVKSIRKVNAAIYEGGDGYLRLRLFTAPEYYSLRYGGSIASVVRVWTASRSAFIAWYMSK